MELLARDIDRIDKVLGSDDESMCMSNVNDV